MSSKDKLKALADKYSDLLSKDNISNLNATFSTIRHDQNCNIINEQKAFDAQNNKNCMGYLPEQINAAMTDWKNAKSELNNSLNKYKLNIRNYEVMGESNFFLQQQMSNIQKNMNNKRRNMAINRRMADFYSQQTSGIELSLAYSRVIYWILCCLFILATIIFTFKNPQSKDKKKLIFTNIFFIIFPFINSPFFYGITKIFSLFPMP